MPEFNLIGFFTFLINNAFVMQQYGNDVQIEIKEKYLVVSQLGMPRDIYKHEGIEDDGKHKVKFTIKESNLKSVTFKRTESDYIGGQRLYDVVFHYPGTETKSKYYAITLR